MVKVVAAEGAREGRGPRQDRNRGGREGRKLKVATPKAKPPSTTTPHLKPKPKHAPKHATNAWPAKSVAKAPKAATTHANLALNVRTRGDVKEGQGRRERSPRGERNEGRRERAPRLDENGNPEVLPLDNALAQKAKHRKPTRTVANVVSAAHATATAVTAASVATAHRVKKVLQNTPTTAPLLSTTRAHDNTLQMSKPHNRSPRAT